MPRHARLTDRQWDRIRPLPPSRTGRRGRPWADHRRIAEAIIHRYRTGVPWRDLPARSGSWKTLWAPHPEKCRAAARGQDLDAHREPAGHAIGRSRSGLTTKIHYAVDAQGRPLAVVVTPGQTHDGQSLPLLPGDLRAPRTGAGRPRTTPTMPLGDNAYSPRATSGLVQGFRVQDLTVSFGAGDRTVTPVRGVDLDVAADAPGSLERASSGRAVVVDAQTGDGATRSALFVARHHGWRGRR
ncbi:transposase [Streptomyces sp. NPDC057539]|uniref:transposase n=1 Tax=Streptomyces sp. NPDC057539 TaxID=3346159 RepID=UPI0036BC09A6